MNTICGEYRNDSSMYITKIKTLTFQIESMELLHGLLVTADIRGRVTAVNHDGALVWQIQGQGPGGRMVCLFMYRRSLHFQDCINNQDKIR